MEINRKSVLSFLHAMAPRRYKRLDYVKEGRNSFEFTLSTYNITETSPISIHTNHYNATEMLVKNTQTNYLLSKQ